MTSPNKLYTFIDSKLGISCHYLNADGLLQSLDNKQKLSENAVRTYQKFLLSSLSIQSWIKAPESFNLYIDSEEPYLRFKLEAHHSGTFRCLLLPAEIDHVADRMTGICRISKYRNRKDLYHSVVDFNKSTTEEILNQVYLQSFQTQCRVYENQKTQRSLMVHLLPISGHENVDQKNERFEDYLRDNEAQLKQILELSLKEEEIIKNFESKQLQYVTGKEVKFFCPCSKENMMGNLLKLGAESIKILFSEQDPLYITCDYCASKYTITESELKNVH